MASNNEDPFFIVRDEVQKSLTHLQSLYDNWVKLNQARQTPGSRFNQDQFKWTSDEIKSSIKTIEWDIQDLEETVRIVDANPQKFKLDALEVQRRKRFVEQSKSSINNIQMVVSSVPTGAQAAGGSSNAKRMDDPLMSGGVGTGEMEMNDDFIRRENQQQQIIMEQQDTQLDQVYSTVVNLKNVAVTIGTELDDQHELLDRLDSKVDYTGNRLENAMKRIQGIMKKDPGDNKIFCCIVFLSIVVFVLFIMLFV